MRGLRSAVVLSSLLLLLPTLAQARIRMVDASDVQVALAAGSSATLAFTLRNESSAAASVQLGFSGVPDGWSAVAESTCPLPQSHAELVSLPATGVQSCSYRLTRLATTADDQLFSFYLLEGDAVVQTRKFLAGDLTALQTSVRVTRFGTASQPARAIVEIRNLGPTAVGSVSYGTCNYGGSGTAVSVVGGDCSATIPIICFSAGGFPTGFTISNLPVGAVKTCELQWAGSGAQSAFTLPLFDLSKATPPGARLLNSNRAADAIGASGVPQVTQLPTNNIGALVLLLAGIAGLAVVQRGRSE